MQNSFGSVAYGKAVAMTYDHDRRSSVERARSSPPPCSGDDYINHRVKHVGAVLIELVAVDESD